MANVFDGGDFLKEQTCELKFSNGFAVTVQDVPDEAMDSLTKMEEDKTPSVQDIRGVLASMIGEDVSKLEGVKLRELNAGISFLSKALFE